MSRSLQVGILIGVPLLLRLLCLLELRASPFHQCLVVDARWNHEQAVEIANGALKPQEAFWQPPLYPYAMGLIYAIGGVRPELVRIFQILVGSLSCLLAFALGRQFFGSTAGWVAWGILTLHGTLIFYSLQLLNVTLAIFLLLLFLWLLTVPLRSGSGQLFGAGLALGLAAITVAPFLVLLPIALLWVVRRGREAPRSRERFPPPFGSAQSGSGGCRGTDGASQAGSGNHPQDLRAPGPEAGRGRGNQVPLRMDEQTLQAGHRKSPGRGKRIRSLLQAGPLLLGTALPVGIVTWTNLAASSEPILISHNGGLNFWIGNNPDYERTVAIRPGRAWKALTSEPQREGHQRLNDQSDYFYEKAFSWIRSEPGAYLALLGKKVQLFLRGDEIPRNQEIYPFREHSKILRALLWIHGIGFPMGLLLPLASAGMVTVLLSKRLGSATPRSQEQVSQEQAGAGLLGFVVVILAATVIAFFVTARYRLPLVPLLAIFIGAGSVKWREWWDERRLRLLWIPALVALLVGTIANSGLPSMPARFNSDAYFDLGVHYQERGQIEDARRQYEQALESNPENFEAANNLAGLFLESKQWAEAQPLLEKVLAGYPGDASAHNNLGYLFYQLGEPYLAGSHFLAAARANPPSESADRNLKLAEELAVRIEAEWMARDPETFLRGMLSSFRRDPGDEFLFARLLALLRNHGREEEAQEVVRLHELAALPAGARTPS